MRLRQLGRLRSPTEVAHPCRLGSLEAPRFVSWVLFGPLDVLPIATPKLVGI